MDFFGVQSVDTVGICKTSYPRYCVNLHCLYFDYVNIHSDEYSHLILMKNNSTTFHIFFGFLFFFKAFLLKKKL
jgi:hypothetical protein